MTLLSQRDARIYFHLKFSFERFLSKYTHTWRRPFQKAKFSANLEEDDSVFSFNPIMPPVLPFSQQQQHCKAKAAAAATEAVSAPQREQPSSNLIEICCVCGFLIYILFTKVNCPHFKEEGRCYSMGEEISTTAPKG